MNLEGSNVALSSRGPQHDAPTTLHIVDGQRFREGDGRRLDRDGADSSQRHRWEAMMQDRNQEGKADQFSVLEACRRLQEEILRSREGRPLPSSTELIHEIREEHPSS